MSTEYPVLGNRPIDQWKVVELKEELRRRNVSTKGLKEELVRRLLEYIQSEKESTEDGADPDSDPRDAGDEVEEEREEHDDGVAVVTKETSGKATDMVATDDSTVDAEPERCVKDEEGQRTCCANLDGAAMDLVDGVPNGSSQTEMPDATAKLECDSKELMPDVTTKVECEAQEPDLTTKFECGSQDLVLDVTTKVECDWQELAPDVTTKFECDSQDGKHAGNENVNLSQVEPDNQVSDVCPDSGLQVKCESISNNYVSINEKNELKDNLNADNFHLELIKPEMVQQSSDDAQVGDLHPLDNGNGSCKDKASTEEVDFDDYATSVDISKKGDSAEGGSPEKLNLDRCSGDESMDEDVLENWNAETNNNYVEMGGRDEARNLNTGEEGTLVNAMTSGYLSDKQDVVADEKIRPATPSEKRKPEDHEISTNGSYKRKRRWNSNALEVSKEQLSKNSSSSTPKPAFQSTPKPTFANSESTPGGLSPKERIVPPSQKSATNSLRIDRFLRPFTLKAVQELLAKTGTVCHFWMDQIKTHCYVTYSSAEEAIATRNAVYNLQWPPNGGHLLVAEFVDPQEVKTVIEAPSRSAAPISPKFPTVPKASPVPIRQPHPPQPIRQHAPRQQLPPPPPLPLPLPLSDPPAAKEQLLPPPPPIKKSEPPVITLDDLFKKTRATPRIYYLPLSEEQVAAKLAARSSKPAG